MTPQTASAELLLDVRADLGEGPLWHPHTHQLHFVDITAAQIHSYDPGTGAQRSVDVGAMVGCVAPRADGTLIAALANGLWIINPATQERRFLLSPEGHDAQRCRFNDGKCDSHGRLWAGTMALNSERGQGALYCFSSERDCDCALQGVSISNGLAWNLEDTSLYYIDSPTRQVDAFDYDPDSGRIQNRRTVIALPPGPDFPDGCTLDAEGMLWIAHWGGGCVTRWNPKTGKMLTRIDVPAPQVTSCAFGGAALDTLYITTARRGLDAATLATFPKSGGVFTIQPGVRGLAAHIFRG